MSNMEANPLNELTEMEPKEPTCEELRQQVVELTAYLEELSQASLPYGEVVATQNGHATVVTGGQYQQVTNQHDLVLGDAVLRNPMSGQVIDKLELPKLGPVVQILDYVDGQLEVVLPGGASALVHNATGATPKVGNKVVLSKESVSAIFLLPEPERQKIDMTPVTWDMIGGQKEAKAEIREAIELPHKHKKIWTHYRKRIPKGIMLFGAPGCIAGKSFLSYETRTKDGRRQNLKGGTIEHLYKRFHHIEIPGKGWYQRKETVDSDFFIQSVTDDGKIVLNQIRNVVQSGEKEVFRLTTEGGRTIETTADHEFLVPEGYRRMDSLSPGDAIYFNPGKPRKKEKREKQPYRPEVFVKIHPSAPVKVVNGCHYYRLKKYQAVYEAHMNGMKYNEYINLLNKGPMSEVAKFWTIPHGMSIHHKDENFLNDSPDNLVMVEEPQHQKEFHREKSIKAISVFVETDQIVSIEPAGVKMTYDLVVDDPFRNFVADGIVVHNCGKTMIGKALAHSIGVDFLYIKGPELLDPYVGVTESRLRSALKQAAAGKMLFLDEADAILGIRGSRNSFMEKTIVPTFLSEIDGLENFRGTVILATNRPDAIDPAVMRDGRMDRKIEVRRPGPDEVCHIFGIYLSRVPTEGDHLPERATEMVWAGDLKLPDGKPFASLASGALVEGIVDKATSHAIRRDIESRKLSHITEEDLREGTISSYKQNLYAVAGER